MSVHCKLLNILHHQITTVRHFLGIVSSSCFITNRVSLLALDRILSGTFVNRSFTYLDFNSYHCGHVNSPPGADALHASGNAPCSYRLTNDSNFCLQPSCTIRDTVARSASSCYNNWLFFSVTTTAYRSPSNHSVETKGMHNQSKNRNQTQSRHLPVPSSLAMWGLCG